MVFSLGNYAPDDVIAALEPHLTPERKARIQAVLAARLVGLTVVLENLHDPHNGAAAIRSLEGFGVGTLHVVESKEPFRYSNTVTQGCEKWVEVHKYRGFDACRAALGARGFKLWAAVPGASTPLEAIDVTTPAALVFGNEHAGLSPEAVAACDGAFTIPMTGFTQSFNLSVSVAVCVHDAARRRREALGDSGDLPGQERARLQAKWYALSMDRRAAQGFIERYVSERPRSGVAPHPRRT
jgi:tRNA (guanosine-2'-O-)-methyltransferase